VFSCTQPRRVTRLRVNDCGKFFVDRDHHGYEAVSSTEEGAQLNWLDLD
jgi:hypothetical protein